MEICEMCGVWVGVLSAKRGDELNMQNYWARMRQKTL